MISKNSYEKYLRKEYSIPKNKNIVIKRGFVISKDGELLNSANFASDPFEIRNLVYNDIKNEISKIYTLIERASEDIDDLLRLKEIAVDEDEQTYNLQIELAVDSLFSELSNSMIGLTNKAYKSFIFRLNENSKDHLENFEYLCNYALRDKEIYVKINLWVENLKKWFLDNMESNLYGETNSVTSTKFLSDIESKGFFNDVLGSVEDFFDSLKDKIDRLIFNIVSFIQTRAKKLYFKARRIKKYQVVLSSNSNICSICESMAGKIFDIDELNVGTTAPPFHPNCGCTIIPYVESDEEPQDEEEEEQEADPTKKDVICDDRKLKLEEMQINATYIYNYLIEQGWTKNAICGMFGNMQIESYFSPGIWEDVDGDKMQHGFGLTQWTPATKLIDWAEREGLDPFDIDTQLYRILQEANIGVMEYYQWNPNLCDPKMTFYEFTQSTQSPEELAEIFMRCYERPDLNLSHLEERRNNAAYWYSYFGNKEKRK